jgi:ribosomal protein S18 acetylase RimI-like enzyme
MPWRVRRAVPSDAEEIARINVDGARDAYPGIAPHAVLEALDVYNFAAAFGRVLAAPDPSAVLVAVDGDRVGAFCSVCPVRNAGRDDHPQLRTAELAAIYADPPVKGTGAGHAVHDTALRHLAGAGFEHAVLWVVAANDAAQRFYRRHGWEHDGVGDDYDVLGHAVPQVRFSRSPG